MFGYLKARRPDFFRVHHVELHLLCVILSSQIEPFLRRISQYLTLWILYSLS